MDKNEQPRFHFFTPSEVQPKGWMKRQLEIQAKGLGGNLHKVWPDIRDSAWIGGNREGWERVPYWLDGFIPLAYLLRDEQMITDAKRYIDAILSAQQPDGWLCPCKEEERATYDSWALLLISKVLTVYYHCSMDERIPEVLYRALKNFYTLLQTGKIHLFSWGKARWFEGCIAIRFVYERTGEAWLTELAALLKQQGTDYTCLSENWKTPLNRWCYETHLVNLVMMLKQEAVSCDLLGQAYTDSAEAFVSVLKQYNGTPVETFTGDECLAGLSPIQGTELCAVVEQMYSYELLYAYTGDPKWAERLEMIAFNALPATVSDAMWSHQYDQLSNQIACEKFPGKPIFRTNGEEAHLFGLEPNFGCCTANFNQGWPKFALSAFLHKGDNVLCAIPLPMELKTKEHSIRLDTNYPFDHFFVYTVKAEKAFTLRIRIPSFAENLTVNGNHAEGEMLTFSFAEGENRKITVSYEVKPAMMRRPHGLYTAQYGSLVFSLPIAYKARKSEYERNGVERKFPYCDYELVPQSEWGYVYAGRTLIADKREISEIPFSSKYPPVVLKAKMQRIDWGLEDGYEKVCAKIPRSVEPLANVEERELYPYGCAKLRMTELPLNE